MERILILDDEISICTSLEFALEDHYEVKATTEPEQAIEWLKESRFHLCLLDLRIDGVSGIDVLQEMKSIQKDLVVIIMTAYGSIATSVEAIKKGAYTYLTKPLQMEGLLSIIDQALEYQELNQRVEYLSQELEEKYRYEGIVGKSPQMKKVFETLDKLKDLDTNVLVYGESGTGKELIAKALHYSGNRKKYPFVALNCAAIPENLLESELFGHKKGAFSGAVTDKPGKFQYAEQGTLFLDEIGDMPIGLQAKLLRVLQEKEVTPLGSNKPEVLKARVVAATNQDLKEAVEHGKFREDLYYRLNVVNVFLPPLREIRQDLPLFFQHFMEVLQKEGHQVKKISEEAMKSMLAYDYPGNIRELSNILEAACVMAEGDIIEWQDLPENLRQQNTDLVSKKTNPFKQLVGFSLEEIEKQVIFETLQSQNGHRKKTADILGISERGLRNKINRYGLHQS
ncbi:sigma-54-dependent transcriptional regulator [Tindallia californiensis]|uniref:Stage 0 sporulation protein A homolog n=1 Tax=Tindallia californiensis TaxID=159292 RepID=A0A1H3L517_9FIRM|nr:sigma-54 dependent transcriptional regulator [Tindallia californiensis]SDY59481.1 two-component system, NtrC family, response regulator AtoC [Tindallia californiensis]